MTPEEHQVWTSTYERTLATQISRAASVQSAIQEAAEAAHFAVAQYNATSAQPKRGPGRPPKEKSE